MVKEPAHGLCPLRHRKGQYVKMMAGKTQLQQTKSNLSSKTKCCKKGKGGTTHFGGLDEGADDTSDQSAKAKPYKTARQSLRVSKIFAANQAKSWISSKTS